MSSLVGITTAHVVQVFLRAMREGYVSSPPTTLRVDGHKSIIFRDKDFLVCDKWTKADDGQKSLGSTTVSYFGMPVWVMHYGGHYDESAISTLKCALRSAYEADKFYGGRGPSFFADGDLLYLNHYHHRGPSDGNPTDLFNGREEIYSVDGAGRLLGWHEYWGMSILAR